MSKVAHYLQEHLSGEVTESIDARRFFSTDMSIFSVSPSVIVYPRTESDVRKTARFTWQLAERGRVIPITSRGLGTDLSGAAIGSGIMMAFPAHMNRIIQLDTKSGETIVEPGLNFGRLQQTLETHERFLPAYPNSIEYSTIGGAVANNASGQKSYKYGSTQQFVKSLRVVLANGEVITTGRLSKRELSKKLGLSNFEGEIYRQIDALIEDNKDLIFDRRPNTVKNNAGYNLHDVKLPNGSFDLTPLIVGSQGTLGIITEITLSTEDFNPETSLMMAGFDDTDSATEAVNLLRDMTDGPSSVEFVDSSLLAFTDRLNPNLLKKVLAKPYPKIALFIEFDNVSERTRKRLIKKTSLALDKLSTSQVIATDYNDQIKLWKIRQASSSLLSHGEKSLRATPIIDDAVVPPDRLGEFLNSVYKLFAQAKLQIATWGHAGEGSVHIFPFFSMSELGDRQRAYKLLDEYYKLVISFKGSISGQHNDGRIRGPKLEMQYGSKMFSVFKQVKKTFDPHGTLNPGVKVDATFENTKPLLRSNYGMQHLHNHMPRV